MGVRSPGSRTLLFRILFTRPWHRVLLISLSAGASTCGLLAAFFQKEFIDRLLGHEMMFSSLEFHPLTWLVLSFVALLFSLSFAQAVNALGASESIWMQRSLANDLYRTVLSLQPSQLRGRTVGEVVAIYTTDIPGSTILLEQSLPQGFGIFFPLLFAPLVLIHYFHLSAVGVTSLLLIDAVFNLVLAQKQSLYFYNFKQLAADRLGIVNEWIQNLRTLRILSWMELFEKKIFKVRIVETENRMHMLTNGQTMNAIASSMTFLLNAVFILMLVQQHPDEMTPGKLLALFWIVGVFLTRPFRQMPWFFTFVFDGWTSLKRLHRYLILQPSHLQVDAAPIASSKGIALQVEGLNLKIDDADILKNLNFQIKDGEFVAIVGEVGVGKSQLLLSLLGETPAHFRRYQIGEKSVHDMTEAQLHDQFSFIPQEGFVISATLRENVVFDYGDEGLDNDRVRESLVRCEFDPGRELHGLQLETEIGERGVNLSGGQRQRVSLARVDYHEAPILLLDDCFSALDVDTEKKLIRNLFHKAWKGKTRILVTHRLTVLDKVDRIFFLRQGELVATGTWKELMRSSPDFVEFTQTVADKQAPMETPVAIPLEAGEKKGESLGEK